MHRFASTFQMLRGTLVLFAGLLTIVLLKRRLHIHHWLGMALIVAGAVIVGASSVIFDSNKRPRMEQPFHGTRRLNFLEACRGHTMLRQRCQEQASLENLTCSPTQNEL